MKITSEPTFFSQQVARARRFYIEGAITKDPRIKVVCGGCEHTHPDFRIDRKGFPYYSIEFVAKGRGTAILKGQRFDLGPGTIFSYGPRISQIITTDSEHLMTKYFIDFTGEAARQMIKTHIAPLGTAIRISRPDEIARIMDDLINHGLSDSSYRPMICSALLEYLIYRIAETRVTEETKFSRAFMNYQNCRQQIKDNFTEFNSLQDIAESCSIDHAYLCRLFKKFDTQTPYQYLIHLKMAYAAQSLQKPDILVKEVAYELGFGDPFHFSRVFKKVFGISPQKFKNLR